VRGSEGCMGEVVDTHWCPVGRRVGIGETVTVMWGLKSASMPDTTDTLIQTAFHFGRKDLEERVLRRELAQRGRPLDPRQAELEATIFALKAWIPRSSA
jgi:hypothetical protein